MVSSDRLFETDLSLVSYQNLKERDRRGFFLTGSSFGTVFSLSMMDYERSTFSLLAASNLSVVHKPRGLENACSESRMRSESIHPRTVVQIT